MKRVGWRGPWRMLPAGSTTAARLPFVLLMVGLLVSGLVGLLLLNTALNSGSFRLSALQQETKRKEDAAEGLRQRIQQESAPGALAKRAGSLGMVPGGAPAFLAPGGGVKGDPSPAAYAPAPVASPTPASPSPAASPSGAAAPSPGTPPRAGGGSPGPSVSPSPSVSPTSSGVKR
ncbi:hypothetical protein BIV57_07250 [Mangrovactinospora gilvigrisea]|uniref:Cell division protein FtsL n=1 Tax=Mangrovactinospora gilvigrisea TaxID=1428644 RepID=A0A1J7BHJ6_9ACTN|nr:hypothetical protein [Mangrovactinospora gilvigrisea]OIV38167.1 hypothetical protein BIV57_07250 [Mangrovactinospora gilvigrisea]